MPSNSYDLVVLGDDLAALVCGTLCARRGMRTLVLGTDRPARYTLGPHKLPIEPVLWPVGPTSPGSACSRSCTPRWRCAASCASRGSPRRWSRPTSASTSAPIGVAAELARELGPASDAALARWQRGRDVARLLDPLVASEHAFPGVGFFERRETTKLAEHANVDASAWWSECDTAPAAYPIWRPVRHRAAPPECRSARDRACIDAWHGGPSPLRGDGDAIRELLVEKLTTAGGEVRAGTVAEIDVSWGKLSSLTLAERR